MDNTPCASLCCAAAPARRGTHECYVLPCSSARARPCRGRAQGRRCTETTPPSITGVCGVRQAQAAMHGGTVRPRVSCAPRVLHTVGERGARAAPPSGRQPAPRWALCPPIDLGLCSAVWPCPRPSPRCPLPLLWLQPCFVPCFGPPGRVAPLTHSARRTSAAWLLCGGAARSGTVPASEPTPPTIPFNLERVSCWRPAPRGRWGRRAPTTGLAVAGSFEFVGGFALRGPRAWSPSPPPAPVGTSVTVYPFLAASAGRAHAAQRRAGRSCAWTSSPNAAGRRGRRVTPPTGTAVRLTVCRTLPHIATRPAATPCPGRHQGARQLVSLITARPFGVTAAHTPPHAPVPYGS